MFDVNTILTAKWRLMTFYFRWHIFFKAQSQTISFSFCSVRCLHNSIDLFVSWPDQIESTTPPCLGTQPEWQRDWNLKQNIRLKQLFSGKAPKHTWITFNYSNCKWTTMRTPISILSNARRNVLYFPNTAFFLCGSETFLRVIYYQSYIMYSAYWFLYYMKTWVQGYSPLA